jgi:hypothetical protein
MEVDRRTIFTLNDLRAAFANNDCCYPTPLSLELYERARAEGFEMVGYYAQDICMTRPPTPERRPWGSAVRYLADGTRVTAHGRGIER